MGLGNLSPTMHTPGSQRSKILQRETRGRQTASRHRVFSFTRQFKYSKDSNREPNQYHVHHLPKARSDHSTLDVWAWRNKSYLLMAKRLAAIDSNQHRERTRSQDTPDAAERRQMEEQIPHISRNCRRNGATMVLVAIGSTNFQSKVKSGRDYGFGYSANLSTPATACTDTDRVLPLPPPEPNPHPRGRLRLSSSLVGLQRPAWCV